MTKTNNQKDDIGSSSGFKQMYLVPVLVIIVGVVLFAMLGNSSDTGSSDRKVAVDSSANEVVSSPNTGSTKIDLDPESIYVPISEVNDGKAHFYKYELGSKTIEYFVLKSSDNIFRAAFNACDVCYSAGKGYRQEGDYMVCNNCGQKFLSTRINEEKGGCNPAPLDRTIVDSGYGTVSLDSWTQDGYLKIKKSDIEAGSKYFF